MIFSILFLTVFLATASAFVTQHNALGRKLSSLNMAAKDVRLQTIYINIILCLFVYHIL